VNAIRQLDSLNSLFQAQTCTDGMGLISPYSSLCWPSDQDSFPVCVSWPCQFPQHINHCPCIEDLTSFSSNVFSRSFQICSLTNHTSITLHMIKCHCDWLQPDEETFSISLDANIFHFVSNVGVDLAPVFLTSLEDNRPVLEIACQAVCHCVPSYILWHD